MTFHALLALDIRYWQSLPPTPERLDRIAALQRAQQYSLPKYSLPFLSTSDPVKS